MRLGTAIATVSLACLAACTASTSREGEPSAATSSAENDDEGQEPSRQVFVPVQFQTVQAAVNAVADGGTVRIAPGTYSENVIVAGKNVHLRGQGQLGQTTIAGVNQGPVVTFSPGAGGSVRNLVLTNGSSGVFAHADQQTPPAHVAIRHAAIDAFGFGVVGTYDRLDVDGTNLDGRGSTPYALAVTARALNVRNSAFKNFTGIGVFVENVPGTDCGTTVENATFDGNGAGGVRIKGHGCPVFVDHVSATGNGDAALDLRETGAALIESTSLTSTFSVGSSFGDGLRIISSPVTAVHLDSSSNQRAGVSVFGCESPDNPASLTISDSTLLCDAFEVDFEAEDQTVFPPTLCKSGTTLDDGGGNTCSSAACTEEPCKAQTAGAITPVPSDPKYPH
jgi:hypothetical protein